MPHSSAATNTALLYARTSRRVVLLVLLFAPQDFRNCCGARTFCGFLLAGELGFAILLLLLHAKIASLKAPARTIGARFLVSQFTNTPFGYSKIGRQWNMAGANQVAAATFNAICKPELA